MVSSEYNVISHVYLVQTFLLCVLYQNLNVGTLCLACVVTECQPKSCCYEGLAAQRVFVLVSKWQQRDRNITATPHPPPPPNPHAPTSNRSVPLSTVNDSLQHSERRRALPLPGVASVAESATVTYLVSVRR